MLKVYPRGYIGPTLGNYDDKDRVINELTIVKNTYKLDTYTPSSITPDKDVESLFQQYRENEQKMIQFAFREDILKKAKTLFSFDNRIKSFKTFLEVQLASSRMTYNHIEVLKEVMDFIHFQKVGLKIITWERILSNTDRVIHIKDRDRKDLSKVFSMYPDLTVTETITKWVGNIDGYPHLLRVMWLFFGDKLLDER